MSPLIKVPVFVLVNLAGCFTTAFLAYVAIRGGVFPESDDAARLETVKLWLFGGGAWMWIFGALASIAFFVAAGPRKWVALFAPLYLPALYVVAVLSYFNLAG